MSDPGESSPDPWARLRTFTRARIGLARCGDGISTDALLQFQLDHANARDAVNRMVDFSALARQIGDVQRILRVHSAAVDRRTYLRRPDLGRILDERSRSLLVVEHVPEPWQVAFIIADGLSSAAVNDHAAATLAACLERLSGWKLAPVVLATQARVALGDEISVLLNTKACVVLIGERPGLSIANSLGAYLTWQPKIGHRDAARNCVSNIHSNGLTYEQAADKICWLLSESARRLLSGAELKENAGSPPPRLKTSPVLLPAQFKNED